ncbi:MAG: NADH-quinone oxidoreductase subunit B family protein [Thermoplasmata archaeon]
MSNQWFLKGLKKGIVTEKFPKYDPEKPPLRPSILKGTSNFECPVGALNENKWNPNKCIFCDKCTSDMHFTGNQKLFKINRKISTFKHSLYIYIIDSGTCGACNIEFLNIFSPQYDANRYGIFLTNTPRNADVLLIMGVESERMKPILELTYEAIPEPKQIIQVGTCAISGGIIGSKISFLKPDALIFGCPPSPYTILEALIELKGDKP